MTVGYNLRFAPVACAVPLGMTIVACRLPGAKGNQVVAAVEEALVHLA
ncbi:hypothetical protein ACIP02_04785 [Pseudomonas sp. NPDC089408]